jgi:hypothetical protein
MTGIRKAVLCSAFFVLASPADAKVLRLTCTDAASKSKYEFAYDTARRTLTSTHKDFTRPLEVQKTQDNVDGLLVWGEMPLGPATKNVLLHFGKEKWAVHFFGYDEKRKDACV